jgi:MarR family transcriptional regulator, organic hydroperoxide resistance regulator
MLEQQRSEQEVERLERRMGGDNSLLPPLGLAFWRMKRAFEREVGISAAVWFLLSMLINEDGISQGEVSHRFEVDPSRITRLAQRLEQEGLLRRERDAEDSRVVRLHATKKGRRQIERCRKRRERFEDRILQKLSEQELMEFRRVLGIVSKVMKD